MNKYHLPEDLFDFNSSLFLNEYGFFDHYKVHSLLKNFEENHKNMHYYGEQKLIQNDFNFKDFKLVSYFSEAYFYSLNRQIMQDKNADCLDELISIKSKNDYEKFIKFLTFLMIYQEFFGAIVASEVYTNSDFWNVFEGSDSKEKAFMNIHVIHFLLHKNFTTKGMFSLYENSDLNNEDKFIETRKFGSLIGSKFQAIAESDYFDEFYKPYFGKWAELKQYSLEKLSEVINESVSHGTHAEHPVKEKLSQLSLV